MKLHVSWHDRLRLNSPFHSCIALKSSLGIKFEEKRIGMLSVDPEVYGGVE